MKSKPVPKTQGTNSVGWLPAVIGLHIVIDFVLINRALFLDGDRLLFAVALPFSQCSLAALWAANSRSSPYLRFALPPLTVFGCWYVLAKILPWGIGEPASAACVILLAVQTLTLLIVCNLYRLALDLVSPASDGTVPHDQSRWTFQVRTLMLWTTVIALAFGFVQYGRTHWGWTSQAAFGDFSKAMFSTGFFNALLAGLWLWALAGGNWTWRAAKIMIAGCLIALMAYGLSYLVGWLSQSLVFSIKDSLILAATQSVLIVGSITVVLLGNARMPRAATDAVRSSN